VARDRKRAKQRRERRGTAATNRGREGAQTLPPSQPTRADVPGALDHASGEVDEFDAALVRGAGGVAATPEVPVTDEVADDDDTETGRLRESTATGEAPDGSDAGEGGGAGFDGGTGDGGAGGDDAGPGGDRGRAPGAPLQPGNRAVAFLRASWAELQRVQWPDRRQVTQATAVVLGFVAIAGAYLGLADVVAKEIVEFVL
jgi:preprotein translocase SecE subunit